MSYRAMGDGTGPPTAFPPPGGWDPDVTPGPAPSPAPAPAPDPAPSSSGSGQDVEWVDYPGSSGGGSRPAYAQASMGSAGTWLLALAAFGGAYMIWSRRR